MRIVFDQDVVAGHAEHERPRKQYIPVGSVEARPLLTDGIDML